MQCGAVLCAAHALITAPTAIPLRVRPGALGRGGGWDRWPLWTGLHAAIVKSSSGMDASHCSNRGPGLALDMGLFYIQ